MVNAMLYNGVPWYIFIRVVSRALGVYVLSSAYSVRFIKKINCCILTISKMSKLYAAI